MRVAVIVLWGLLMGQGCVTLYCSRYATDGCVELRTIAEAGIRGERAKLQTYLTDPRSWVREEAAKALGQPQFRTEVPDLLRVLTNPQEKRYVRAAAARSLGRIGDRQVIDALVGVAAEPAAAPELKLAVIEGLCALQSGPGPALSAIQSLTRDQDIVVAAVAQHRTETTCVAQ